MGQKRTSRLLFDHCVCASEQRGRHGEAERLRGFEVDDGFVLGRHLHRQVGRLLALEDAVDVAGRAPVLVGEIRLRISAALGVAAGIDLHVAADGPAQLRQRLEERPEPGLPFRIIRDCGQEHADAPHALALLRARYQRHRRRGLR
jgi:hypothetical protein